MAELTEIQTIAVWAIPVLFAITLHEVAHGWIASKLGDQTARLSGRLTINPIKHIDLVGTILVPIALLLFNTGFIFGWAKPVPVDSRNLRNPKRDMAFVAAAGPVSNLIMAVFWAIIAKSGMLLLAYESWFSLPLIYMGQAGIMINVLLCVLNCIPIPPLDGARVAYSVLPPRMGFYLYRLEPYGFLILLLLMLSNMLGVILNPLISFVLKVLTSIFHLT